MVTSSAGLGLAGSRTSRLQTSPLVREGAAQQEIRRCLTVIDIWSQAPRECPIPEQTGGLTVGGNLTPTPISVVCLRISIRLIGTACKWPRYSRGNITHDDSRGRALWELGSTDSAL
jgi:hypothetical protein